MLTENEKQRLKEWASRFFHNTEQDSQTYDSEAHIDSNITFEENKTIMREQIKNLLETNSENKLSKKQTSELELTPMNEEEVNELTNNAYDRFKEEHKEEYDEPIDLDKVNVVCILANIHQGKTNLGFWLMNSYKGKRTKYLLGYPKKIKGYKILSDKKDLSKLKDSIVFIDEIAKFFKFYDKSTQREFLELLSTIAHKNNTFIFTTQLTQMITRPIEAFIDCWCIKRIDLKSLKWGSKPKRIIEDMAYWKTNSYELNLDINEYYEYTEGNGVGQNSIKTFPFQNIGKDWR